MESPLSFDSTENFRKKLLLKNLKPYTVDGTFSAPKLENKKEIVLVDYSVSDSPDINKEQKQQEKKLIGQNKYNPNNGFGDIVNININNNSETNFGNYTFNSTNKSKLELKNRMLTGKKSKMTAEEKKEAVQMKQTARTKFEL